MASISAYGTGSAARTRGSAALPTIRLLGLAAAGLATIGAAPSGRIDVEVAGLRSAKGNLLICVTRDATHFPDCERDPASRRLTLAATTNAAHFPGLPSGDYAVSVVHDENGNGRLDMTLRVPREGVGFSRNPRLLFGPPRFANVRVAVGSQPVEQKVQLKYFL